MKRKKAMGEHFAKGLMGIFHGWGRLAGTTKATLYIGARTGLNIGPVPEGKVIPKSKILKTVIGLRAGQIGPAAGATTTVASGRYKGKPEPTYKIEFFPDESLATFKKNVRRLAEQTARDLGQREVYVELIENGKKTTTYSATPLGAPSPLKRAAFCSWVRKHSASAKRPGDECYRKDKR